MSKIETGGPAFPVDNVIARDDIGHLVGTEISSGGMTLRDYFMAHAPEKPQDWFIPEMPPCPVVPSIKAVRNPAWRVDLELQESWNSDSRSFEAQKWFQEQHAAMDAQSEWQKEFRKHLCVQWPAAWADAMLEARK